MMTVIVNWRYYAKATLRHVILRDSEGSAFYGSATADKQQIAQDDKNYRFLNSTFVTPS
jgi:hypothetical protein